MQLKLPGLNQGRKKPAAPAPTAKKEHILKQDFIVQITGQLDGYLKKDIGLAVDIILETMAQALIEGQRVEIRGFGSFETRQRKAKVSRNPKTDKVMHIPPRKTLHFTMSKSVKDPLIKR
ncbi:MAG: integration host factor subunit beta [Deltaproteobacteria bacterium CG_4_10_14_3_um_filter_60_8]|nr:MAG: integration host factor subunit beta [Deltaproteobacteria bacterium CG23_combo_of_CG06-09_8_20_14_all_60_8]PIY22342.1 MAG: integration host factor subunit beta [Deltaproteobacteria bacterium CG_4_10_14_3_um_filter_60_8]